MKLSHRDLLTVIKRSPLTSIDLVIRNDSGEVLLGLRRNEPAKNYWFVPGGRILLNESIAAAFERIAREELGTALSFHDACFLGVFEHFFTNNFAGVPGIGTHYIVLAYEVRLNKPLSITPDDQHHQLQWFQVKQLSEDSSVHPKTKAYFALGTL